MPNSVVVVDDEIAIREMVRMLLEKEGFRCFEAGTKSKATSACPAPVIIFFT